MFIGNSNQFILSSQGIKLSVSLFAYLNIFVIKTLLIMRKPTYYCNFINMDGVENVRLHDM